MYKLYHKKLHFKFRAGTSRGYYTARDVYYLTLEDEGRILGIGECAPLPNLSAEYTDKKNFEQKLRRIVRKANTDPNFKLEDLKAESSILMAFESALLTADRKSLCVFNNDFTEGKAPIKINGLIWMGDYETMRQRLIAKIEAGFKCIKIKIGAIDFAQELELLKLVRTEFSKQDLILRADANGAFEPKEAESRLEALSKFDLHSIEQPIKAGQLKLLEKLCRTSPIPIALDEELIGITDSTAKEELLAAVRPQYLVLKPTLHGGLKSTIEWIRLAKAYGAGYWITSALESSAGLSTLAQFTAGFKLEGHQGLGTGQLFTDNLEFKALRLEGENLFFDKAALKDVDLKGYLS